MRMPPVTIALVVLNAGLLSVVGVQWVRGSQHDALLSASGPTQKIATLKFDASRASSDMEIIQTQALFHKSRKFHVAPLPIIEERAPPDYRFSGSMTIPNRPVTAILINNQTNARVKVAAGDQLDGWTVASIELGRVRVLFGDRHAEIASASASQPGGFTRSGGSQHQPATASSSPAGGVRVLSGSGNSIPTVRSTTAGASADAPRLYRPPGQ